jgi:hypothetical protein
MMSLQEGATQPKPASGIDPSVQPPYRARAMAFVPVRRSRFITTYRIPGKPEFPPAHNMSAIGMPFPPLPRGEGWGEENSAKPMACFGAHCLFAFTSVIGITRQGATASSNHCSKRNDQRFCHGEHRWNNWKQ